jgi:hypothetical protein
MAGMIFAAAVVPELAHGRTEMQRSNCARTMNILGRGCLLYAADWDESMPSDRWLSSVANIHYIGEVIKSSGAHTTIQNSVKCPAARRYGYAMLADMVGRKLSTVPDPARSVLVFETTDLEANVVGGKPSAGHTRHGSMNILLANGSIEHRPSRVETLLWSLPPLPPAEPAEAMPSPAKPHKAEVIKPEKLPDNPADPASTELNTEQDRTPPRKPSRHPASRADD